MSLPININQLINGHTIECERLEFKKGWNPEAIIHTICAFSNDINNWGGGYIIVGVEETAGKPVLPPTGINSDQIDKIQKELLNLSHQLDPYYFPIIEPIVFMEKTIILLWIPGGDNRPYKAPQTLGEKRQKRYYIRRGSSSVIANHTEEKQLFEQAAKIPFDDRINHQANIDGLHLGLIQAYLQEIKSDLYSQSHKLSIEELGRKMQIVDGPKELPKPKNIGVLFFSEHPEIYIKGAITDIVIFKDNDGKDFTEKQFKGPLHKQLRSVLEFMQTNVINERVVKIPDQAESLRFYNYPYQAIEEIFANAFYHRSYEEQSPIEIRIYPNRIECLSFPGPLPPVSQEMLQERSIVARSYRNRRIGDFFKELELTEGRATGFPTIYHELEKNGSPKPKFKTDAEKNYFLATIYIHPYFQENKLNSFPSKIKENLNKILIFCATAKSRKDILEYIGVSNHTKNYTTYIIPLIETGLLSPTIPDNLRDKRQQYITITSEVSKKSV